MKKILFLMSCLLIQGSLLFAGSNSKDHGKNSKSKVEAAAAPASAAAAASAQSPYVVSQISDTFAANLFATVAIVQLPKAIDVRLPKAIIVETPQFFNCPAPKGYRAFACHKDSLHQHFCKEDAEKQAHEFPVLSSKRILRRIKSEVLQHVRHSTTAALKQQEQINPCFSLKVRDLCRYKNGNRVKASDVDFSFPVNLLPHRSESPMPDGCELAVSINATQQCSICDVDGAAHKHFKKK